MKKKVFYLVCVAIIGIAAWNVSKSNNDVSLSDVALDNIEALASGEATKPCKGFGSVLCSYNNIWVYEQK
ncbi:MAG: NVEALA domain-containing protein [Prevotellaceae bacterium]|jgi:hypothetical protein|nr:NVEALA domain-containing protein [Prevotellaceae bacterium]